MLPPLAAAACTSALSSSCRARSRGRVENGGNRVGAHVRASCKAPALRRARADQEGVHQLDSGGGRPAKGCARSRARVELDRGCGVRRDAQRFHVSFACATKQRKQAKAHFQDSDTPPTSPLPTPVASVVPRQCRRRSSICVRRRRFRTRSTRSCSTFPMISNRLLPVSLRLRNFPRSPLLRPISALLVFRKRRRLKKSSTDPF